MKLTCMVDNLVRRSGFWGEHGLSWLIELDGKRVLFDTGQSGTVLLHNLAQIGIGPDSLDALAISHAHYDHTGGLPALLELTRPGIPLYAHPDLFTERYTEQNGRRKSIGISLTHEALAQKLTLRLSNAPQQILPGLWTSGEITARPEAEGRGKTHIVRAGSAWAADPYRDDMALVLEGGEGTVLLLDCGHAGLLNTLAHVKRTFGKSIATVAGGTHLGELDAAQLQRVIDVLGAHETPRRIYANHCTGETATTALALAFGPSVVSVCPAGAEIELG